VAILLFAFFMEASSKQTISRAIRLRATEAHVINIESAQQLLLVQATTRARIGLTSAIIGTILMVIACRHIRPIEDVNPMIGEVLRVVPMALLIIYSVLALMIV
jgi:hypothetical protein